MSSGGGSRGNGVVAAAGIPAGARKMVQSIKEIVNLADEEIYFTLKECGMDPSEAVQRLLSQDSFHEVKSKRDKKKEVLEAIVVKPSAFFDLQPQAPQSSPGTSIPTGHAVPQHLPLHPYSQATLPLPSFTNVISYPFLPHSYTYLSSAAFPQTYTTNNPFHHSPAAAHNAGLKYTLPQYKSSISMANLPQPASVASGYGNFTSSTNIPGNFSLNPSTTPTSTTLGFSEALSSQYKEGTHYLSLQQNESSPMWVHGGSSRTVSPLPPNTFYGFQGQNQLSSFRQVQQSSHYGQMGYLNFFQNQLGG